MIEQQGELIWAEAGSMRALYDELAAWQAGGDRRRLRSLSIEREHDKVCAIGLTGPQPSVIASRDGSDTAVVHDGRLMTGHF